MVRRFLAMLLAASAGAGVGAPPSAAMMYTDAMAREQTVRAALRDSAATESVLKAVRSVIDEYESLVRRYPTSGYCDNALWQAGHLSLDAFKRFREAREKDVGIRLLTTLSTQYPTSTLARRAVSELDGDARGVPAPLVTSAGQSDSPVSGQTIALIKGIRRAVLPDVVRVIIEVDGETPFHEERISGPARIFVDFASTRTGAALASQTLRFESDIVRQIRIGRHPNDTTRVVLDAADVSSYSVYPLYNPYRLVIDCVRLTAEPEKTVAPRPATGSVAGRGPLRPLPARPLGATWVPGLPRVLPSGAAAIASSYPKLLASRNLRVNVKYAPPSIEPVATAALAEARVLPSRHLLRDWSPGLLSAMPPSSLLTDAFMATATDSTDIATGSRSASGGPSQSTIPGPPKPAAGFSMARQLGLGVSRIVIDPGHGGHDTGAMAKGITEAELVLDVSLRLQQLLQAVPGLEVILTRQTDEFVSLQERTAMANRDGADLFLSIHANANVNSQARGIETYFLNFANSVTAAAVAARENSANGQVMGDLPDVVKAIALNNKLDESRDFARHVQRAMVDRLRGANKTLRDLGVKQAPFVVLVGAAMPSALAEVSFLTNPQEARLLRSGAYRQRIAEALFSAVRKYQTSLKNVGTVAGQ